MEWGKKETREGNTEWWEENNIKVRGKRKV